MKILLENEYLEIIEAGTNHVIFDNYDEYRHMDKEEDEDEEDDSEEDVAGEVAERLYKIKLYKNTQSQNIDKTIKVLAVNMYVQAVNESSSILYLINKDKQAVYCTAWEMVHSVDSEEASLLSPQ